MQSDPSRDLANRKARSWNDTSSSNGKDLYTGWRPKFTARKLLQMKLRRPKTYAFCESLSPLSMLLVRRNNSQTYKQQL